METKPTVQPTKLNGVRLHLERLIRSSEQVRQQFIDAFTADADENSVYGTENVEAIVKLNSTIIEAVQVIEWKRIDELLDENEKLKAALADGKPQPTPEGTAATMKHLVKQNEEMGRQLAEADEERSRNRETIANKEAQLQVLYKEKKELEQRISTLEQRRADNDLKATRQKLLDAETGLAKANERIEQLEQELKSTAGHSRDNVDYWKNKASELEKELTSVSDSRDRANSELAQMRVRWSAAESKEARSSIVKEDAKKENRKLHRQLEEANEKVAELEKELDEADEAIVAIKEERDDALTKVSKLTQERNVARDKANEVIAELAKTYEAQPVEVDSKTLDEMREEYGNLSVDELLSELNGMRMARDRHYDTLCRYRNRIAELKGEIETLLGENAGLAELNEKLRKENNELQQGKIYAQSQHSAANCEVERLRKQLHGQVQATEQTLKAEREVLAGQRDEAIAKATRLDEALTLSDESNERKRKRIRKLEGQLDRATAERDCAERLLGEVKGENLQLKIDRDAARHAAGKAIMSLTDLTDSAEFSEYDCKEAFMALSEYVQDLHATLYREEGEPKLENSIGKLTPEQVAEIEENRGFTPTPLEGD